MFVYFPSINLSCQFNFQLPRESVKTLSSSTQSVMGSFRFRWLSDSSHCAFSILFLHLGFPLMCELIGNRSRSPRLSIPKTVLNSSAKISQSCLYLRKHPAMTCSLEWDLTWFKINLMGFPLFWRRFNFKRYWTLDVSGQLQDRETVQGRDGPEEEERRGIKRGKDFRFQLQLGRI